MICLIDIRECMDKAICIIIMRANKSFKKIFVLALVSMYLLIGISAYGAQSACKQAGDACCCDCGADRAAGASVQRVQACCEMSPTTVPPLRASPKISLSQNVLITHIASPDELSASPSTRYSNSFQRGAWPGPAKNPTYILVSSYLL